MEQDIMQSYFNELSKAYYFTYQQIKRLKGQKIADRTEEIQIIKMMEKLETKSQYFPFHVSKQELAVIREKLEKEHKEAENVRYQNQEELKKWRERGNSLGQMIEELICNIDKKKIQIIITSKEQIIALINFYSKMHIKDWKIINREEESLKCFPIGENYYKEFWEAYCTENDDMMKRVHYKYF